jgi:mannosyltransferase OCH1-like enzyme
MPQIDRGRPLARVPFLPRSLRIHFAREEMRERSEKLLEPRQFCLSYARRLPRSTPARKPEIIWQYWDQGEANAPPIISACLASVRKHCTGFEIRVLDATTLDNYITLPAFLSTKKITRTHLSDLIRLELLATYGGTWLDASIFLTGHIPEAIRSAAFFCYTRDCDPYLMSSWLLSSERCNSLIIAWRDALFDYWRTNDALIDYFFIHHMFEAHVTLNREARKGWQRVPYLSSYTAHKLQHVLLEPFSAGQFASLCDETSIHKLTYKLEPPSQPHTFFEQIITGFGNEMIYRR